MRSPHTAMNSSPRSPQLEKSPHTHTAFEGLTGTKDSPHHKSLGKSKSKLQWDTTSYPTLTVMATIKWTDINKRCGNVEKLKPLCAISGKAKWCCPYGQHYGDPQKNKNGIAIWPSSSTSGYIDKSTENRISKRHLYTHGQRSFIHNS